MEAATPLPFSQVRVLGDVLVVDGLRVDDPCAVRLARDHDDPAALVRDAIEIGARVLDREQTSANTDFVKAEFERTWRELDAGFVERAGKVAERLDARLTEVFGDDDGHLAKLLGRHFGEESASAVQHQIRQLVTEALGRSREELVRQFSAADGSNPLADFKAMAQRQMQLAAEHQQRELAGMRAQLTELTARLAAAEQARIGEEQLADEAERGTAKGRTYEEAVFEAVDAIAVARGDDCDAVGDLRGEGGKKGDVVVSIDACAGPARGRIVFEAKDRKLSKNAALDELDQAIETRSADYGILVVPSEDELPARTHPLREFNGNKLFVVHDPADGSRLALDVAYSLARARVLMARSEVGGLDAAALRVEVERAGQAMEDVRRIKSQLKNAVTGIDNARGLVDTMAAAVRQHLAAIDELIDAAAPGDAEA
jgi:hypothetical protein